MKMILTVGLPGCGKTSWAMEYMLSHPGTVNVNRDDIRFSQYGTYWNPEVIDEDHVSFVQRSMINGAFKRQKDVIISDTNLNRKIVRDLVRIANLWGASVEFKYLDVPLEELYRRDENRSKPVGKEVILALKNRYAKSGLPDYGDLVAGATERVPYVPGDRPDAIIVDLDGTVALHNRSPYDYDRLHTDDPNVPVIDLVQSEYWNGKHILFTSGRPDSHRDQTVDWIDTHIRLSVGYDPRTSLLMRKASDKRMDAIVKYEIFDEHIRDNFNVKYALDDRNQVVDMWRSIGVPCFQVNYGEF